MAFGRSRSSSPAIRVRVVSNDFGRLSGVMRQRAGVATRKAALDLEAGIKRGIQERGLIDTGAMLNSVQARKLPGPYRWLVEVGQSYAIYHVFGTRHLPARDFWHPPIEQVSKSYFEAMGRLVARSMGPA